MRPAIEMFHQVTKQQPSFISISCILRKAHQFPVKGVSVEAYMGQKALTSHRGIQDNLP